MVHESIVIFFFLKWIAIEYFALNISFVHQFLMISSWGFNFLLDKIFIYTCRLHYFGTYVLKKFINIFYF